MRLKNKYRASNCLQELVIFVEDNLRLTIFNLSLYCLSTSLAQANISVTSFAEMNKQMSIRGDSYMKYCAVSGKYTVATESYISGICRQC